MKPVKTYSVVDKRDEGLTFSISKMEDIYERRKGLADEPHRHDYYTVLLVVKGNGVHKVDFQTYEFADKQIFFVSPGQIHQVIENEKTYGFVMTFSTDFLVVNSIPLSFISDLNLFRNYDQSPPLELGDKGFDKALRMAEEMFELFHSAQHNKYLSIGAYLKLLLIQCSNRCTIHDLKDQASESDLIRQFKQAVDQHYKEEHSARFYANLLNITPGHLNRSIKNKLGKTAKEYIQARIITEAKRLLYFTGLTNKEVGYELGFNEPANFSAFFKKYTTLSPSKFKKQELSN